MPPMRHTADDAAVLPGSSFGYHGNVPSLMKYYGEGSAHHYPLSDLRYAAGAGSVCGLAAGDDG